jgi:hypothetical protein
LRVKHRLPSFSSLADVGGVCCAAGKHGQEYGSLSPYQVNIARPELSWCVWRFIQATASRIPPSRTTIRPVRAQPQANSLFTVSHSLKIACFLILCCNHRVHTHL